MSQLKLLYVTCESTKQSQQIGRLLVEEKLAGCVNILPNMESIYSWDSKIQSSNETIMIVKTTQHNAAKCIQRIKELHSYKVPCILEVGIDGGNPDYLHWLRDQTLLD